MPYVAIRAYPRDEEKKRRMIERINQLLMEEWDCTQESITISMEEIAPADWEEQVVKSLVEPNLDKMMILSGKRAGYMTKE